MIGLLSLILFWVLNPSRVQSEQLTDSQQKIISLDIREVALSEFFIKRKCPELNHKLIKEYIKYADQYNIDYRLLPAISVIESTCGKHYPPKTFNIWGWNSAQSGFPNLDYGVKFISEKLATGRAYAGQTVKGKLRRYCPNPTYPSRVISIMYEIEETKVD